MKKGFEIDQKSLIMDKKLMKIVQNYPKCYQVDII